MVVKAQPSSSSEDEGSPNRLSRDLQTDDFTTNVWDRETSELPSTEAFTDSVRGTPYNDHASPTMAMHDIGRRLPTRPGMNDNNSGLDVLGKDIRKLMDAIQRLRHLGFETSVIPLPKIVVVGDQSTGKSSVIEGISGIKVPREAGTCTRCPYEINLASSETPWQCKVFLSRRFFYNPSHKGVSKVRPYGPWELMSVSEDQEFITLDSKGSIAEMLFRAQLILLNPGTDPQNYHPSNPNKYSSSMQVEFSPNIIRLDITGAGLPNLAFYDLPGMISHVEETSTAMPKLIENLVREYIRPANTIILLTLTMNHDIQNSKTAGFISKIKPDGDSARPDERTLAVFTKPDLLSPDMEGQFADIFAGHLFKRRLGYFAVKNNHNPNIDHATARREEADFFASWPTLYRKLGRHKERFGTLKLQEELSRLLGDQIRSSLPVIRDIIQRNSVELERKIAQLPKPPTGNLSLEVSTNVAVFSRDLEKMFKDISGNSKFMEKFQKLTRSFRQGLVDSHPRLEPGRRGSLESTSKDPGSPSPLPSRQTTEYIMLDDDDDDTPSVQTVGTARSKKRTGGTEQVGPQKRLRVADGPRSSVPSDAKVFELEAIREMIAAKDDTGFPGSQNPVVTKEMYSNSISHWKSLTREYLQQCQRLIGSSVQDHARKAFLRHQKTELWNKVEQDVRNFMLAAFEEHAAFTSRCLKMESNVFTLDRDTIASARKIALEEMLTERRVDKVHKQIEEDERGGRTITDTAKSQRVMQAAKSGTSGEATDDFQMEIEQMATVRGYYHYASTRFAEYVTLCLRTEVFTKCADELCPYLTRRLQLDAEDANVKIRRLMEVSPNAARERDLCEQRLQMLRSGLEQIRELEESSTNYEVSSTPSTVL